MTHASDNLPADAACAPAARRQPHVHREHGEERVDPYAWLSRRDDPAVLDFLRANNRHAEAALRHTSRLQARIERELKALTPPDEGAPPCRRDGFLYRLYHAAGRDYPFLTRRRDALFAESLSAGGLLLGAVMNRRPDLFRGVVALAPFVDLLSTMANPECPLTAAEYAEWGDPRIRHHWVYMRGYSPCDNVRPAPYPHLLATASLNDSQVPFWEPAKWVARLRDANQAPTHQLLRTNLAAGHAGTSGRLRRLRDLAFIYAFLLDLAGIRG